MRKKIEIWETWLRKHSQSAWYNFQVRLDSCELCPKNRPFEGYLEKAVPQLQAHKGFIPTPQKDPDCDHYLSLEELLEREYIAPDSFLPDNPSATFKGIKCTVPGCDWISPSFKESLQHRRLIHPEIKCAPKTPSKSTKSIVKPPLSSKKRERENSKKSPPNPSPKKKVRFQAKDQVHDAIDSDKDDSDACDSDENIITEEELDFFYGSTTFGRQVKQLKESRRKSV